jgi:nitrogen fixation NifU-like protein
MCGDQIQMEVQFSPDKLRLADAAFTGQGCTISQAAASMLLEDSVGKPVSEILSLEPQQMLDLIGMPLTAARVKCALLGFKVLKDALRMQCK